VSTRYLELIDVACCSIPSTYILQLWTTRDSCRFYIIYWSV